MTDPKTIAIDFDDTLTAMPDVWRHFIEKAKSVGHTIVMVTARRDTEENREIVRDFLLDYQIVFDSLIFTNLNSKLDHVAKRGLRIDIWIDDNPHALVHGH